MYRAAFAFLVVFSLSVRAAPADPAPTLSIVADPAAGQPAQHGMEEIFAALKDKQVSFEIVPAPDEAKGKVLIICGLAGLFPSYLAGSSLTSQASQVIPHVFYLAGWIASLIIILLGGARLRVGVLLSLGLSVVTFGFFFSDAGEVIAGGSHIMGAGLALKRRLLELELGMKRGMRRPKKSSPRSANPAATAFCDAIAAGG